MSAPRPNAELLARAEPAGCHCETCVGMCRRACWPTPQEAAALLDAGHARKLMADWWEGDGEDRTYILCGALPGRGGREAPELSIFDMFGPSPLHGGCAFHERDGRCALHASRLKPVEGRLADHDWPKQDSGLHEAVAATLDSDEGRAVVDRWRKEVRA